MDRELSPSELVGREAEVAVLRRAVDRAGSGSGGVVLLVGEAGIGKSRLLREVGRLAGEAGMTRLAGRAVQQGGPYRPLAEALLGHLRDTTVIESPDLRPFRSALSRLIPGWAGTDAAGGAVVDPVVVLGEGLLRLLRQVGDNGCVVLIDDLHWADSDSVDLVEFLAGSVDTYRILVVAAARSDESGLTERLLAHERVTVVEPGRLGRNDIVTLAVNCVRHLALPPEVDDFLVVHSEGLPLAVEELLSGLIESRALVADGPGWQLFGDPSPSVPSSLSAVVARRLASLDADQRMVVDAAAVLGRDVDWALIPQVAALTEDAVLAGLRAAVDCHLLVSHETPGRLRWRHGLIRDAVVDRLNPGEHSVLARRAAEALTARRDQTRSADDDAAAVELFVRAGDGQQAADLLTDLAHRAIAVGALRTADEQLARAARLATNPDGIAGDRVRVLTLMGRVDEAFAEGEAVLGVVSGDSHAGLCLQLARTAVASGRWDQASRYVQRAGRPDDPWSLAIAADVAFGTARTTEAADLARRAVSAAERARLPEPWCAALEVLGRCARTTDAGEAIDAFQRAASVAAEHGLVPARISALLALGTVELLGADESDTLLEARELALDAGMLHRVCDIDQMLTDCALVVKGPVAVAEMAGRTVALAAGLRLHRVESMVELIAAHGLGVQGDTAAMTSLLDAAGSRPHAPVEATAARPCIEAMVPLVAHDLPQARDLLDRGIDLLRAHGESAPVGYWGLWVLVRTVLDDRGEAARETLRHGSPVMRAINRAALAYADAVASGRAGRTAEATGLEMAADRMVPTQHWWRRLLRLLAAEAAIADGWGDPVGRLRADLTDFETNGDDQLARTCRTLLRRAGVTVRRGRGDTAVPATLRALGVTSREMDVLVLLTERQTNTQVAERLFLSIRTVETHVSNLLAKTGTASRIDLVTYAARVAGSRQR